MFDIRVFMRVYDTVKTALENWLSNQSKQKDTRNYHSTAEFWCTKITELYLQHQKGNEICSFVGGMVNETSIRRA